MKASDIPFDSQILRTKLFRPRILRETVSRPRVVDKLDQYAERLVTLVTAPAGYGKSTAVSQWLDTLDSEKSAWGWVSLDQYDNDPLVLADYLIAAIRLSVPEFGLETRSLLGAVQEVAPHYLADSLVRELLDVTTEFVLVLDDVHLLQDPGVIEFMERLIAHMPYNIHFVLMGRSRPALSLVRLRLHGQLGEMTTADLAFRPDEAAAMLSLVSGRPVTKEVATIFDTQTEGWAAGLQLGGLALRARDELELVADLQTTAASAAIDYLIDEVISLVPNEMRQFMLRTAVLDRLGAELCARLVAEADANATGDYAAAQAMLTRIHDAQLFLLPLDEQGHWFRYHHLLQDTLLQLARATYGPEWVAESHRRASDWYLQAGQITEAIYHARAAGDDVTAARLVETHYHLALDAEDKPLLSRWLRLVPDAVKRRPGMLVAQAWAEHLMFRIAVAAALARQAEALLDDDEGDLSPAEVASLRADILSITMLADYLSAKPFSGDQALAAVERVPRDHHFSRGVAALATIFILHREQRSAEALAFAQRHHERTPSPHAGSLRVMLGVCSIHLFSSNLSALLESSRRYEHAAQATNSPVSVGWARLFQGYVAYMRNDLEEAEVQFNKVIHRSHERQGKSVSDAYTGLCLIKLAEGDAGEARRIHSQYEEWLRDVHHFALLPAAAAVEALIDLAAPGDGEQATAGAVADPALSVDAAMLQISLFLYPKLVHVRRCLAESDELSLRQSLIMLDEVEALVRAQNEQMRLMEIRTLRAVALDRLGESEAAFAEMQAALEQGRREGYIRPILDCGPAVVPLLEQARRSGVHTAYVDRLLDAWRIGPPVDAGSDEAVVAWADLTNREIDVLEGLQRRMSNKEIAAELFLSPLTVKRHAQNLYRKLGASNRREAVEIARHSGLLS